MTQRIPTTAAQPIDSLTNAIAAAVEGTQQRLFVLMSIVLVLAVLVLVLELPF